MPTERKFDPLTLSEFEKGYHINLPAEFIHALSAAPSLQEVLDTVSQWIHRLFDAERASITLQDGSEYLKLYSISGNKAIPLDFPVPIAQTFVGRAFSERTLIICDDLAQSDELDCIMLSQFGMKTCMDAPLLCGNQCLGTLNVAHNQTSYYSETEALELQCLANWIALNINLRLQVMELNQLASTDHLTGAPNRRVFTKEIQHALAQFHSDGASFFLGLMDIDHFKILNDQYGHNAGDYVLKQVVGISSALLGSDGHLSRIGGEEFALILHDQNKQSALAIYNAVRHAIEQTMMEYDNMTMSITVSIGITQVQTSDLYPEQLLKRADKALYAAKSNGRNLINCDSTGQKLVG
ncbi:sensor domain-containing diguanylate cyclase [Vibrio fluvialis]|nr:sensor domain-containing diguanylate cyclase [Vibrio fluvialis]ELF6479527.1 sensor domain-containing diguanylate cyclase [Vibrio fluvialis]ELG4654934.1 sensor domain-containing diguanylate cyclase [Vibrio fluvialis]